MKRIFGIMIAIVMVLGLVACGEKSSDNSVLQQNDTLNSANSNNKAEVTPAENSNLTTSVPPQSNVSEGVASAKGGTLTLSKSDIAVVINGNSVTMPYKLKDLEAAGVPADESRNEIELGAGDFFTANLYLDDNEDYLIMPAYYNEGDSAINIAEAEAKEITMTSYADDPTDQGVSILGVSFGMTKNEVKALLGEPMLDEGSYLEWHIELPDMAYEGTLSMYLTEDAGEAGVSQVNLNVFEK